MMLVSGGADDTTAKLSWRGSSRRKTTVKRRAPRDADI
jgi:hypothetical protein